MYSLTALVDCNSFFASCERVFRPELKDKPVLVLSNNDGCVIARTQEVKDLGIGMGVPYFKVRDIALKNNVSVFSSNYALYGDMSNRVMQTFTEFTPDIEVYSIDEAFLNFQGFEQWSMQKHGENIRKTVLRYTGIPTSVGIAPTKVLAKVANHLAKKNQKYSGVCVLDTMEKIDQALESFPIEDLWGIGRKLSESLYQYGITTAQQFRDLPESVIRKLFSVQEHRMSKELKGITCFRMKDIRKPKKQIISTRSFGKRIYKKEELEEALANHISNACAKLRKQKSTCRYLYLYIRTGRHSKTARYYGSHTVTFDPATSSTQKMLHRAKAALQKIYRKGYPYKKCGIHLSGLSPANQVQSNFFQKMDTEKDQKLMQLMDQINMKEGRGMLKFAACGAHNINWSMKSNLRSPCYTTRWSELLKVS